MAFLAFLFFLEFTPKTKEISTPKRSKPALLHLNADLLSKSGYLSGYLSRIYLFSCILDKEYLYLWTHFKKRVMKKHYLIMGDPDTGKSHLAKLITENKKIAVLEGYMFNSPFVFSSCSRDTEFIVVDDVDCKHTIDIIRIALRDTIKVNKPHEDVFEISPKFIIVTRNKIEINQLIKNNFFIYEAK